MNVNGVLESLTLTLFQRARKIKGKDSLQGMGDREWAEGSPEFVFIF